MILEKIIYPCNENHSVNFEPWNAAFDQTQTITHSKENLNILSESVRLQYR